MRSATFQSPCRLWKSVGWSPRVRAHPLWWTHPFLGTLPVGVMATEKRERLPRLPQNVVPAARSGDDERADRGVQLGRRVRGRPTADRRRVDRPSLGQVLRAGLERPPKRVEVEQAARDSPLKRALQSFQVAMLREDYADLAQQPRFGPLVVFFFQAIYAPRDFGERNESFRALHRWLVNLVGRDPVQVLANAIELYELTESLDDDMVLALRTLAAEAGERVDASDRAGATPSIEITRDSWEAAFRRVGRRLERHRQTELLLANGAVLETAARVPLVRLQLQAVRPAAALLGWGPVIDFLLDGQEAIVRASPTAPLLDAIRTREQARIERLLGTSARKHDGGNKAKDIR